MNADELLGRGTQVAFIMIWLVVLGQAVRRPRSATIRTAIFFGLAAVIIVTGWIRDLSGTPLPEVVGRSVRAMAAAMPFTLVLLADDFAGVPRRIQVLAGGFFLVIAASLYFMPAPLPPAYAIVVVVYLIVLLAYSTARFAGAASVASGVTRRRMQAVAVGGGLIGLVFIFAGLNEVFPAQRPMWASLSNVASFACGVAYFTGFAPPRFLRRAWQAPQLLRFFGASTLVRRESFSELLRVLEGQVGSMLGNQQVVISIWDDGEQRLASPMDPGMPITADRESTIAYRSFRSQQPMFVEYAERSDPTNAAVYRQYGARSIIAAPITLAERRFGMLLVFGEHAPLFAEDELEIVEVLARQIAILLRDFELTGELTGFRAHEEAQRLKEDFLAAAAHDLKTPLTALIAQSQLMQRRAARDPQRPTDIDGVERIVRETARMRRVVDDLLDAAQGDQLGFVTRLEPVDLTALVSEVMSAHGGRRINFDANPVTIRADAERIRQVINNLRDNALKYSPNGGDIDVGLVLEGEYAVLTIRDQGIGIAAEDLGIIFERFRRAPSVRYGSMTGLGLGLYFSKRIVEEHGGTITVRSVLGQGSEFEVRLPVSPPERAELSEPQLGEPQLAGTD
jgi:signal transduction histidine kinase